MNPNEAVHQGITLLGTGLNAHIQQVMKPHLGGTEWPSVLKVLDQDRGKTGYSYVQQDVALQLRMITERLGSLGYPFDAGDPNRTLSSYGSVLRIVRKRWAHNDEFSVFDALSAVETIRTVLRHIADEARATQAAGLRGKILEDLLSDAEPPLQPTHVGSGEGETPKDGKPAPAAEEDSSPKAPTEAPGRMVSWEPWEVTVLGEKDDLDGMRTKRVREVVRSLIEDIVDTEGPVHRERLGKLVGYGFGFSRVRGKRLAPILNQVKNSAVSEDTDGFVWPENIEVSRWLICRQSPSGERIFEEVSPVELSNGLIETLRSEGPMNVEELGRQILALFGRTRMTKAASDHLGKAVTHAQHSGRMVIEEGKAFLPTE